MDAETLEQAQTEQTDALYEAAENGIQNIRRYLKVKSGEIPSEPTTQAVFCYTLKNGKKVYRSYSVDKDLFTKAIESYPKSSEIVKLLNPITGWKNAGVELLSLDIYTDNWEGSREIDDKEKMEQVIEELFKTDAK